MGDATEFDGDTLSGNFEEKKNTLSFRIHLFYARGGEKYEKLIVLENCELIINLSSEQTKQRLHPSYSAAKKKNNFFFQPLDTITNKLNCSCTA